MVLTWKVINERLAWGTVGKNHLPVQGTRVRPLVWGDPTRCGATEPGHHSTEPEHHSTEPKHHGTEPEHHSTESEQNSTESEHHSTDPEHHSTESERLEPVLPDKRPPQ